jgi:hypothetical protein
MHDRGGGILSRAVEAQWGKFRPLIRAVDPGEIRNLAAFLLTIEAFRVATRAFIERRGNKNREECALVGEGAQKPPFGTDLARNGEMIELSAISPASTINVATSPPQRIFRPGYQW